MKVEATEDKLTGAWDLNFTPKTKVEWNTLHAIVGILKATIPASDRTYDVGTKHWSILAIHYPSFKAALKTLKIDITEVKPITQGDFFYEETLNAPVVVTKESLADQLCRLLQVSSEELADAGKAKKIYRAAALAWHPDRNNGDGSKMSELNSLWSAYNAN